MVLCEVDCIEVSVLGFCQFVWCFLIRYLISCVWLLMLSFLKILEIWVCIVENLMCNLCVIVLLESFLQMQWVRLCLCFDSWDMMVRLILLVVEIVGCGLVCCKVWVNDGWISVSNCSVVGLKFFFCVLCQMWMLLILWVLLQVNMLMLKYKLLCVRKLLKNLVCCRCFIGIICVIRVGMFRC